MHLQSIRLMNFRCFIDTGEVPLQKFSLFIGKNDGGKSSCLLALQKLLKLGETFSQEDCWLDGYDEQVNGNKRAIELEIRAKLTGDDEKVYHIRAKYNRETNITLREIETEVVEHPELNEDITQKSLNDLKRLCSDLNIVASGSQSTKGTFITALNSHIGTLKKSLGWKPLPSEIASILPKVYLYSSVNDLRPDEVIKKHLQTYFKDDLVAQHKDKLTAIRTEAQVQLNIKADSLTPAIKVHCPTVKNIKIGLDENSFSNLVISEIRITQNDGRPIIWEQIGAGKKREMSLGIFRWQQQMLTEDLKAIDGTPKQPILVLFDEPDVNLDYEAQQLVNRLLQELSTYKHCQVIVATHSVSLMDSLPIENISFFSTPPQKPWRFDSGASESKLLEDMRATLGLRNSALFNEKLMLIVEGQTEINILDILYKEVTGYTLLLSGVYPINGHDNAQALHLASLIKNTNNKDVVLILDEDCRANSALKLSGSNDDIKNKHGLEKDNDIWFVGQVELEDLFEDQLWAFVLNEYHPKIDGTIWESTQIMPSRIEGKFSENIGKLVELHSGGNIKKPELGRAITMHAISEKCIPAKLEEIINHIQQKTTKIHQLE